MVQKYNRISNDLKFCAEKFSISHIATLDKYENIQNFLDYFNCFANES